MSQATLDLPAARIAAACDSARRRLERDLHDGAQQRLVSLSLRLGMLATRVTPGSEVEALLDSVQEELAEALKELRDLAHGLHPALLTAAASRRRSRRWRPGHAARRLDVDLPRRPAEATEVAAYYVVSEALANIAKYACAARAGVTVAEEDDELLVEVWDDGIGGADLASGSGLQGLADRVGALDGRLVVSSVDGAGTVVQARIPL